VKRCERCGRHHRPDFVYRWEPRAYVDSGYARDDADKRRATLDAVEWETVVVKRSLHVLGQRVAVWVLVTRRRVACTREALA
jgi:hypothetical protein